MKAIPSTLGSRTLRTIPAVASRWIPPLERLRRKSILPLMAMGLLAAHPGFAAELRVGIAAVDITPPLGIPMAGYYHARGADGVLDPLFAKALVIESDGRRAAIVALDLISVTRNITDQARAAIVRDTGIAADHVMIAATHAHTGPELADRGQRAGDLGGQSALAVDYTEGLPAKIAETVRLAHNRLQPAQVSAAKGRCEDLTFNRRYFMRDGSVGWNPGKSNPDIVMPAGPSDPEVGLLYVAPIGANDPRQAMAAYVNFAMHTDTCGGSRFSADWPGALNRVLAGYHGTNHLTLVGLGACGNLNHLDFGWSWPQNTGAEGHRIGTLLGAAVFQAYKHLQPVAPGPLRARSEIVELALPEITPAQVEEARNLVASTKDDRGANFMKLVRAYRALDVAGRQGKPHRVEVQVIALGSDVAWVSLPGEVFVELGLAIKQRSPFPHTYVVELANENIGYIPDRRSYAEGNYEPASARCAAGSGEQLVEAAVRLLNELKR
jgi:neutral ceramidase